MNKKLKQINFISSYSDKCVYIRESPTEAFTVVYVDDLILLTTNPPDYENVRDKLSHSFKMKDKNHLDNCLAMELMQNNDNNIVII